MAIKRSTISPESINEIQTIAVTPEAKAFIATLKSDVDTEDTYKNEWNARMNALRDLRYGYRQPKTTPWKGAANYSIPVIDSHIAKIKSIYINLFYNASPIVNFEPYGAEDVEPAKKREQLFDWRMRTKVEFFKDYCIGIDKMLEQGQVVFKIVWDYSTRTYTEYIDLEDFDEKTLDALLDDRMTDQIMAKIIVEELGVDINFEENVEEVKKTIESFRSGETKVDLQLIEIEKNQAQVIACDVKEELVIPRDTVDIQDARFIDHKIWKTANEVRIAMNDEKYEKFPDADIDAWGSKSGTAATSRRSPAVDSDNNDVILLHEVSCWYDVNDDGIKERCIVTYPDADESAILRFIEIPYDHGMFPYEQVRRELNDPLFYTSRGIPELDEDFQIGISHAMNQAEDYGTVTNVPVVVMKKNTVTNIKNRRYTPGEVIETIGPTTDYEIRQSANIAQPALLQFSQYLKSWSDQRVGDVTAAIGSQNNLSGQQSSGQKTKAEVNLISALGRTVSSLDVLIFQQQMVKVYAQVDALYDQYGDDEEEMMITGEQPIKVNRREIQGKFNMVPNGRLETTDPALKVGIATTLLNVGANDPMVNQMELKKMYYDAVDPRLSKKLLYTEEEMNQRAQQQQQQQEALIQKSIKQGLENSQIEMLLDVQKERMMAVIDINKAAALIPIEGRPHSTND